MNKFFLYGALSAMPCLFSSAAMADRNDNLDTVVVVANRQAVPLRQVTTDVSVLTAEDIEARGQNDVIGVLRTLPGISVSTSGGVGKTNTLRIRGEDGFRTRTYIDGIDISNTTAPQVQPVLEHLLSSGIERIEVLRGPQGMMYGADAGGVINIITQRAQTPFAADFTAEYGRFGTHNLYGNVRGKNDKVDYSLSLENYSTDGFNSRDSDTALRDDDGYSNNTAHFNGGVQVNDSLRLEATVRDTITRSDFDVCWNSNSVPTNRCQLDYDQLSYRVAALLDLDSVQQNVSLQRTDNKWRQLADGASLGDVNGSIEQAQYQGIWKIPAAGDVVYGADFEKQTYKEIDSEQDERNQRGAYLEWQGHIADQFFYTAGARHDRNDDFGNHTSYRAGAAYLINVAAGDTLKLRSSYGTGFRAPSLYETAFNFGPWAFPPAAGQSLKEETSKGYDAGIEYHWQHGAELQAVYFNQKIDDLIQYDLANNSGYLQIPGTSRSEGAELSGEVPINEHWRLNGNYTYNDAHDPDGQRRVRRPRHIANLGGSFKPIQQLTINFNLRMVRDAVDVTGINRVRLDNYNALDANATWSFNPQWEVYVRGENLLNDDYQEIVGFNTSKRALYTGLRYHFR